MAEATVIATQPSTGLRPVSPAAHLAEQLAAAEVTGLRRVRLREVAFQTMIGVRAVPGTAAAARIEASLGVGLPATCGAVSTGGDLAVLWLSPDEFLVVTADRRPAEITAPLVEAMVGAPGSVTDLSANRATYELDGPSARKVLEKGCPLDLHPRNCAAGTAYLTLIGSVPVILWKTADEQFRILPRSSYADFLGRWLIDAMAEFKVSELP